MGLLLGAAYKYSGTLWLPVGIHWAWNFTQGNIFGFEVSGSDAGVSLMKGIVSGPDNSFFCGGGGIRTPGALPHNSFQDCRHRTLGHTSGKELQI